MALMITAALTAQSAFERAAAGVAREICVEAPPVSTSVAFGGDSSSVLTITRSTSSSR